MFWECHIVTSSIDKLLDDFENLKLQDLLDENDLIQECLSQNKRLIDYLTQSTVMNELLQYIIHLPSEEINERKRFRYSHVVSELLSGDFQRIQDTLLEQTNLDTLYTFLTLNETKQENNEPLLNPILASYFSRIMITLIIRRPQEILEYLKSKETFKDDILKHLDTTSIMDILYRLISDSGEYRSDAIQWYEQINMIDSIIEQFLQSNSSSVHVNAVNLLSDFIRFGIDQTTFDDGIVTNNNNPNILMSENGMMMMMMQNEGLQSNDRSPRLPNSSYPDEHNDSQSRSHPSTPSSLTKLLPIVLSQRIISKTNLERIFDTMVEYQNKKPSLLINACDFFATTLELLSRHMPAPVCISLNNSTSPINTNTSATLNNTQPFQTSTTTNDDQITKGTNGEEDEEDDVFNEKNSDNNNRMQINDEDDTLTSSKQTTRTSQTNLISSQQQQQQQPSSPSALQNDPLVRAYITFLSVLSTRLPPLINLLNVPCPSLIKQLEIYSIIRLLFHDVIYSMNNPSKIWTRTPLPSQHDQNSTIDKSTVNESFSPASSSSPQHKHDQPNVSYNVLTISDNNNSSSTFHLKNRGIYTLFQSLMNDSNLFERLLDQYEMIYLSSLKLASGQQTSSSSICTNFCSPNSGHISTILRCLRDHASFFDNYQLYLRKIDNDKKEDDEQIEDNMLESKWQTTVERLNLDEKKWSSSNPDNRSNMNNSTSGLFGSDETNSLSRRHNYNNRCFGSSGPSYLDEDDDDDEVERFEIEDDDIPNNQSDSIANERKVDQMKKTTFVAQFPTTSFNEQSLWDQSDDSTKSKNDLSSQNNKPILPDLLENHRQNLNIQKSSAELSFEQLCSLRANDLGPFNINTINDEGTSANDDIWKERPISFTDRSMIIQHSDNSDDNEKQTQSNSSSSSSSSDENNSGNKNLITQQKKQRKHKNKNKNNHQIPTTTSTRKTLTISDDEDDKYFLSTPTENPSRGNNMKEVFSNMSTPELNLINGLSSTSTPNWANFDNINKHNNSTNEDDQTPISPMEPVSSSTPDRNRMLQDTETVENCKTTLLLPPPPPSQQQQQEPMDLEIKQSLPVEDDNSLEDNFNFLVSRGFLKKSTSPSSSVEKFTSEK
ncbi:unnamed protein product [Didymodactylos carnosus]|uniref:Uncharacterized protein n=1 Tax=Didymodactylos carnosus TaxID=1234261 RepID=A0A814DY27_9BILA|nr:unnamed protein product [Didymodactylos carnosus]CAF0964551.1 unnamed protein product [Didymodactylos carnosus]CAF3540902.1 unnamed protein product [Didymodactylos carnosus]CAF3738312.1 unnamed protein product [Didymodactylos carnosus]